jgi:hypothetical protein
MLRVQSCGRLMREVQGREQQELKNRRNSEFDGAFVAHFSVTP